MLYYYAAFIPNDGKVAVFFPDLPGIATFGDNFEHAFTMAADALTCHLMAMVDDDEPMPEPSPRQDILPKAQEYWKELDMGSFPKETEVQIIPAPDFNAENVRVSVSFRRYVLDMIDRKAEANGMTRSGFLTYAASQFETERNSHQ